MNSLSTLYGLFNAEIWLICKYLIIINIYILNIVIIIFCTFSYDFLLHTVFLFIIKN